MTTQPHPRIPNVALRHARQSMRLSQAQFAEAVMAAGNAMGVPNRCTKRLVQKWETGEHAGCRPDYLRVLKAVTGLTARELGFQVLPDDSGLAMSLGVPHTQDAGDEPAQALALAGRVDYSSDEMIDAAMDQLRHAVNHPPTVDTQTIYYVEVGTARLFDLEHHSPARLLAPTVDRRLAMVSGLLTAARHSAARTRLTLSLGYGALLAGWLAFDRGDTTSAQRLWDNAIAAAEGTANAGLFAASLVYQSYASARRGDVGSAWQLAHTASSETPDDLRATAWAASRAALYAAQLGEREAAESAMTRAMALGEGLPSPAPGDGGRPWTRSFDRPQLLSSTALTAAHLGDPDAPDYAAKAVDALGPDKVKARAVVLAEAARATALAGELELCLDYGSAASKLARELESSVAIDLLYAVIQVVLPYSDTRAVRELLPQLARLQQPTRPEDEEPENGEAAAA